MTRSKPLHFQSNRKHSQRLARLLHRLHNSLSVLMPIVILSFFIASKGMAACSVTTTPVSFGVYNVYATSNPGSTGQITVNCNPSTTSYVVALNGGLFGTISQRKLKRAGGADNMLYNLYTDASRTTIWGDGSNNGVTVSSSSSTPLPVYGAIIPLQDVSTGTYTDSVAVTVSF